MANKYGIRTINEYYRNPAQVVVKYQIVDNEGRVISTSKSPLKQAVMVEKLNKKNK